MAYPKEIMDKAFETLAERRSRARNDYQYRLQVIREKVPAVEELRREDYDEMHFTCEDCKDTGYTDGKMCHCLKDLLAGLMLERLSHTANTDNISFASFSLDYYPAEPLPGSKSSARDVMRRALEECRNYADTFTPSSRSMFFQGKTGLGKTHLSLSIAKEVIRKGYNVLYTPAQTLLETLERERFRRGEESYSLNFVLDCDLLILDDLGAEFSTNFSVSVIYNIINSRLVEGKPTIISSNLTAKELEARYSPRVVSRIMGEYYTIPFLGNDIRILKR